MGGVVVRFLILLARGRDGRKHRSASELPNGVNLVSSDTLSGRTRSTIAVAADNLQEHQISLAHVRMVLDTDRSSKTI